MQDRQGPRDAGRRWVDGCDGGRTEAKTAQTMIAWNLITVKVNYNTVSFEREAGSGVDGRD